MNRSRPRPPLTEAEKKWRQEFIRKLQSVGDCGFETAFLDPLQLELAQEALKDFQELSYTIFGGYPTAERAILRIFPAKQHGSLPEAAALAVTGLFDEGALSHRDFLGAVLGLGLRRDQVGDILLLPEGGAIIFVLKAKAEFICARLTQVGSISVDCSVTDPGRLSLPMEAGREISGTVASTRLDAVLALGFGLSRSRAVLLIKGGLAKVNWRPVDSPAFQLHAGDLISLQSRGRVELLALEGETRKGRIRLKLKKMS
ncbi:MAG: photosystem II S4 domain protein [Dethiobacter sp.]|nr:photosystem II S4 domain protein [Dethiobacter sp.]